MAVYKAIGVSHDLYCSALLSAFEIANGNTRPLIGPHKSLREDIIVEHDTFTAKRKLALIVRLMTFRDISRSHSDHVVV